MTGELCESLDRPESLLWQRQRLLEMSEPRRRREAVHNDERGELQHRLAQRGRILCRNHHTESVVPHLSYALEQRLPELAARKSAPTFKVALFAPMILAEILVRFVEDHETAAIQRNITEY